MSMIRPTLSELIARIRSDFETRLGISGAWLRRAFLTVLVRVLGGAFASVYGYLAWLDRQRFLDTADEDYLVRLASIDGVDRKAAVAQTASATATGTDGYPIPAGAELQREDGTRYFTKVAAVIATSSAALSIEALDGGAGSLLDVGESLTFSSPVAGVNAVVTIAAIGIAGADEEGIESLRSRALEQRRRKPMGGNSDDYIRWALAQPGVTRAWPYPGWLGAGTVGLTFVMDGRDDIIPASGDVAIVQAAIDVLRPVTAELTVFAPIADPVDFQIQVTPNTSAIRAAIRAELADFFTREGEAGGTIWLSRASEAISAAEGEFQHRIIAPTGDYTAAAGHLPMRGTVSFT